jgi:hypothetical protein
MAEDDSMAMALFEIQTNVWYNENIYNKPGALGQNYFCQKRHFSSAVRPANIAWRLSRAGVRKLPTQRPARLTTQKAPSILTVPNKRLVN